MTNAEMIKALRWCASEKICTSEVNCGYLGKGFFCTDSLMLDSADALEAAEKRIDELERSFEEVCNANGSLACERNKLLNDVRELEAQLPKEGEWIEDDTTYCGADRANYKCSLCGKICGTWKRGLTQDELPNYCPNCGARMRGEHDEQ